MCVWVLGLYFHVFIFFPLHSSLPPRITQQICKNTLLISRQRWQPPPMTSAPCIPFFSPFSFSFFISCSAPETQILSHCSPLCTPDPLSSHLRGHADMSHIQSVLYMDSDTYRHGLNIIPCLLCSEYIGKQQTCIKKQTQIPPEATAIPMLSDTESFWDWDVLVILPADDKKKKKKTLSVPLFNPKPRHPPPPQPRRLQLFIWESVFRSWFPASSRYTQGFVWFWW